MDEGGDDPVEDCVVDEVVAFTAHPWGATVHPREVVTTQAGCSTSHEAHPRIVGRSSGQMWRMVSGHPHAHGSSVIAATMPVSSSGGVK
jgi:hypothetical protein